MTRAARAIFVLLALGAAGCLRQDPVGRFASDAFYPTHDAYRVRYSYGSGPHAILPSGWELANFDAETSVPRGRAAPDDVALFSIPHRRRTRVMRSPLYDLRYVHTDGEMFARTLYLGAGGDAEGFVPMALHEGVRWLGRPGGADLLGRPRLGNDIWLLDEGWAMVDRQRAYFMTFDLVPRGTRVPRERVTIVGVSASRPPRVDRRGRVRGLRHATLALFGYATTPAQHGRHREAFETFVSRVDLRPR